MKRNKNEVSRDINKMPGYVAGIVVAITVSLMLVLGSCRTTAPVAAGADAGVSAVPPPWAPAYDNVDLVQYYYLPDIECYYDVWNHEYVYLDNGSWMFAAQLPAFYSWYDFNNPFVVVLDYHVHQPWMHYHYYVAHYPRYYYRSYYKDNVHPANGFNENTKTVVFRNPEGKQLNDPRHDALNKEGKVEQVREPVSKEQQVQQTRPSQKMEYYGKIVGRPVRVERQMMRPQPVGKRK